MYVLLITDLKCLALQRFDALFYKNYENVLYNIFYPRELFLVFFRNISKKGFLFGVVGICDYFEEKD